MAGAKRARTAEMPKQPSLSLRLRAPYFYPTPLRIIAFITDAVDVRAILEHIGEPSTPPRITSARGPPKWYEDSVEDAIDAEACLPGDPLAQPEPAYEYDQRVTW
jgi:hypothetical protein